MIRKSFFVNLITLGLVIASFYVSNLYADYLYYSGLFALSGAVTNEIAIFMIFNKIPFLYGSGIIELNFEKFKDSISELIMKEFFTKERLESLFEQEEAKIDFASLIKDIDLNPTFDALKTSILESKYGQVINMFGGESSLELLRVTFLKKLHSSIISILNSKTFKMQLKKHIKNSNLSADLQNIIYNMIRKRLNELSPAQIKELISKLIKEHLDWLVVWGGIFGGIIGFLSVLFTAN